MKRPTLPQTAILVPLVALCASSLTGCVVPGPYGTYGAQPQYAQPAYAQPSYAQPAYAPPPPQPAYEQPQEPAYGQSGGYGEQYGTIAGIRPIGGATSPSGVAGTLVGAVVGGVLGNQIGQNMGQPAGYRVDIRLSDGTMRSLDMQTPGDLRQGDRVRIDGDQISRY